MKKWMIVYSVYCKAVEKLVAAVQPYLDYVPVCAMEKETSYNAIELALNAGMRGFSIEVSECDGENQFVRLTAQDEVNLYYAVSDFENIYLPYARQADTHSSPYYFRKPFKEPLKPYFRQEKPRIRHRGIWLWGYTIYDYRRFMENMANHKLNTLIVWNDHLPVNIRDVIDYAHGFGVKVYLGFAWGWESGSMPDISRWKEIAQEVLQTYERDYARLPCDGIYFQSFTEHSSDTLNGMVVAEAVVQMVNHIGGRLLERHEGLELLFGLHYTSVSGRLSTIAQVDERISIIWEDVGAFPYQYLPSNVEGFEETVEVTQRLQSLREQGFGAVLKGVVALDWTDFHHLNGKYLLGVSGKRHVRERAAQQRDVLRYIQALWIRNAGCARELIAGLKEDAMVTCLVEDAVFEETVNYPTALYAAMLWNSDRRTEDILCETALRPDVDFV